MEKRKEYNLRYKELLISLLPNKKKGNQKEKRLNNYRRGRCLGRLVKESS